MKRVSVLLLGVAGLMLTPAAASAQFGRRPVGPPFGNPFAPQLRPLPSLPTLPTLPSLGALTRIPNPNAFIPRVRIPIQGSGLVLDTRQIAINNIVANYYASGYYASGAFGTM